MTVSAAKRLVFPAALVASVLWLIGQVLIQPFPYWEEVVRRPRFPPTDLTDSPGRPGYRSVWVDSPPSARAIRPDDVVLEIVYPDSGPFAGPHDEPLDQVAYMARNSPAVVVVTLEGAGAADGGDGPPKFLERGQARVDEVLINRSSYVLEAGSTLQVLAGDRTRVTHTGAAQVVERSELFRVPREGRRYLLFLFEVPGQGLLARIEFGNAFEIRGRKLVPMTIRDRGNWHISSDSERAFKVVRDLSFVPHLEKPPTDLPDEPGVRSVWYDGRPLAELVRPTDKVLEVVFQSPRPVARWNDPLSHFSAARSAEAALVVRVKHFTGRLTPVGREAEPTVHASIEQVLKNSAERRMRVGEGISLPQAFGGEAMLGTTRVVTRREWRKTPSSGGRYVVFLEEGDDGILRENERLTLEIRFNRVVPMFLPNPWTGFPHLDAQSAFDQIRQFAREAGQ